MMVPEPLRTGIPCTHWFPRIEKRRGGGREGGREEGREGEWREGDREGGEEGGRGDMTGVNMSFGSIQEWIYVHVPSLINVE